MNSLFLAFLAMICSSTLVMAQKASPAREHTFDMDIPLEWMKLSQRVREERVNMGSDEFDFKWSPASVFFKTLESYRGPQVTTSTLGTFSATYTTINVEPSWLASTLRLRSELSYTHYSNDSDDRAELGAHDLQIAVGAYLEPKFAKWNSGRLGYSAAVLWQQWFSPESRYSSSHHGSRVGLQNAIEVRQQIFQKSFDGNLKAVLTLSRRDFIFATTHRAEHDLQAGFGFAL